MKTKTKSANRSLIQFRQRAVTGVIALLLLLPSATSAGGTVTSCTETDLRAAMAGGGTVTFACDGTITMVSTITNSLNTVMDGSGHQVTLSGGNAVRVFHVKSNTTLTLIGLTVANGTNVGGIAGGILNEGHLILLSTIVQTNTATGWGRGGGLFNRNGTVDATNCIFAENVAQGVNNDDLPGQGGAIFNESGQVNLQNCAFSGNRASGGSPGLLPYSGYGRGGGYSRGGAIDNSGTLNAIGCTFIQNMASGGSGGSGGFQHFPGQPGISGGGGGDGWGGAICNAGTLNVSASTFASNSVAGGNGGAGGTGFGGSYGTDGGSGAPAGSGLGGALYTSQATALVNCTFVGNGCVGGNGGAGGTGGWSGSSGQRGGNGANGGAGGSGLGGIYAGAGLTNINCTFAFHFAVAGAGGVGGGGGEGGNGGANGSPGIPGSSGTADSGFPSGGLLINSILVSDPPNAADLKLGPLADNGGPTLTMALLPGSSAIDAGDNASAPVTDQRGFPRPVGPGADIGAYEYCHPAVLRIVPPQDGGIGITVYGAGGQTCRLLTSTNLADWQCVATNQIGTNGTVRFQDTCGAGEPQRFYKVALP